MTILMLLQPPELKIRGFSTKHDLSKLSLSGCFFHKQKDQFQYHEFDTHTVPKVAGRRRVEKGSPASWLQATGAVSAQSGSVRVCHMVDCSSSLDPFCCVWEIRVSVTEHFWHSFAQLVEYLHLANQAMAVTARLGIQVSNVDVLWQNVHLKLHWANQAFAGLQQ